MIEPKTLEEYERHANGLFYDELVDIFHNIDRDKYPERFRIIENLINIRNESGEITCSPAFRITKKKPTGVPLIGAILLINFVISLPVHTYEIITQRIYEDVSVIFYYLVNPTIVLLILYGLTKERSWVVGLLLIFSAYQMLGLIFSHFGAQEIGLTDDIRNFLWVAFYSYCMIIFSRSKTRAYYKEKGTLVVNL